MTMTKTQMMSEHQLILEASGVGTWRYEISSDEFHCDSVCRNLLGITGEQEFFPLSTMLEHVYAEDQDRLNTIFQAKGLGLETLSFEFMTKTLRRHVLSRARHLPDLGGQSGKLMGIFVDDTETRQLRQSLDNSEAKFEKLARSIPNQFLYLNKNLEIEFANEAFCDLVDLDFAQVEGKKLGDVVGEKIAESHHQTHLEVLKDKHITSEMAGTPVDGVPRYYRYVHAPVKNSSGEVIGILAVATDISERRELERRILQSEAKLRMLVDGFPSLFVYLNKNLEVETANNAFLRASNLPLENIVGRHCEKLLGDAYQARKPYFDQALSGTTASFEDYGIDIGPDAGEQYFRYNYKPATDENGHVIGVLCEATNMTERRKLELDLRRSNKDLEQFAYVASHDLKAPLRAIEVIASWLREDLEGYEEGDVQENLTLLNQRTQRLGRLLDDLLAYSRAGRKVGKIAPTNTKDMLTDILQMLSPPDHVIVTIHEPMPVFDTHAAPLEQVLRNLIGNAVKHHPGPKGHVEISCEETEKHYVFSVSDDGDGVPDEYADRIFEMFQTLKPRDQIEGSGMGLAIVGRIVEWQGGRVWLESAEDAGTVFRFQWSKTAPETNTEERAA